jgi:hypothetical protein
MTIVETPEVDNAVGKGSECGFGTSEGDKVGEGRGVAIGCVVGERVGVADGGIEGDGVCVGSKVEAGDGVGPGVGAGISWVTFNFIKALVALPYKIAPSAKLSPV